MKGKQGTFGENLRAARKKLGWTLRQLQGRTGVSQGLLSCYEGGRRYPKHRAARRIAVALGTSLTKLGWGETAPDITAIYCRGIEDARRTAADAAQAARRATVDNALGMVSHAAILALKAGATRAEIVRAVSVADEKLENRMLRKLARERMRGSKKAVTLSDIKWGD